MNIAKLNRIAALAFGVVLGGFCFAESAHAIPILSFSQSGSGNTVTGTRSGSSTTIATTSTPITIGQIDAALVTPLGAFLSFNFVNTSAATAIAGGIAQNFSGSFCITSGAGCSGTNYLSGTLIDLAFGSGAAFNINASTPGPLNVSFTSSVIPDLGVDRGASFSLANVTPLLNIQDNSIASFGSSVSGTFSASVIPAPEPASLAILGGGLLGLGVIRHLRRRHGAN